MYPVLKYYKKYPDAENPIFATKEAACFDLCAYLKNGVKITYFSKFNKQEETISDMNDGLLLNPWYRYLIPTGLVFDIPVGYHIDIQPRSSTPLKLGLIQPNSIGKIDSDYFHESCLFFMPTTAYPVRILHGQRLAQGQLVKTLDYRLVETFGAPKQKTNRIGGAGSTGAFSGVQTVKQEDLLTEGVVDIAHTNHI